jgi:hypothetical protein
MNPNPHTLPSVNLMRAFGLEPDPWQLQVLEARPKRLLLNCSRQAGKSTTVALLALGEAVLFPKTLVLMLSRSPQYHVSARSNSPSPRDSHDSHDLPQRRREQPLSQTLLTFPVFQHDEDHSQSYRPSDVNTASTSCVVGALRRPGSSESNITSLCWAP